MSGLRYQYPSGLQALAGFDLELQPGEVLAIVGPSGCGKSTLLSLIAGIARPSAGSIEWDEEALARRTEPGQRLAMLFQRDTVLPWRSVEKNIQFGMECLKLRKRDMAERTAALLEIADLAAFAKAYPGTLSGGMRRRVGLLMSLAVRPSVLLLDEPFGALDEPTRVELSADVLRLAYRYGVTVILVTHDLGEAISVADRVIVMSQRPGRVQAMVELDFGHDRDVFTVREEDRYATAYGRLWHELRLAVERQRRDYGPDAPARRADPDRGHEPVAR